MDYDKFIAIEEGCLCFRPEGAYAPDDFLPSVEELPRQCMALGMSKVLVNAVGIIHQPITIPERYHLAVSAAVAWPHDIRLAVVCRPDQLTSTHFGQLVADNRCLHIGVCEDEETAKKWLGT